MSSRYVAAALTMVAIAALAPISEAQSTTAKAPPRTPWGQPDLQGIWDFRSITPLQRPEELANKEFLTQSEASKLEREAVERNRSLDEQPAERTTVGGDVGAYNNFWMDRGTTTVGTRHTSLITDPPNGRIPPLTPEAEKIAAADRDFRLALMRSTETCKLKLPGCAGGKYDPTPISRREELPPRYNTARMNRHYGPEDATLAERCLMGGLPEIGTLGAIADRISFRRIVQAPGGISMFYDVGQGQGWQRNIVMDGSPHLPAGVRQWYGDSRGHWEGNTLVIDVTNFSPKTDFQGSRENLHLIERWARTSPSTLEYAVTVEDPTVWTRPWTAKQEFIRQNNEENRIYTEPRCIEGNFGLPGLLHGRRMEELAFAEGRGIDPRTRDSIKADDAGERDPLQ